MGGVILILLLGLPIAEIAGFVVIGSRLGVLGTLAWVFLAAIAGVAVLRFQGLATALQLRAALARDEPPARALFDGALVAVAGLLLLLPGFISDAIAIVLLFPPTRGLLFGLLARRVSAHVRVDLRGRSRPGPGPAPGRGGGVVIEGEFSEVDEAERPDRAGEAPRGLPPRDLPPRDTPPGGRPDEGDGGGRGGGGRDNGGGARSPWSS